MLIVDRKPDPHTHIHPTFSLKVDIKDEKTTYQFGNFFSLLDLDINICIFFVGRTWRFATLMDDTVDIFISRDLDSDILPREVST